MINVFDVAQYFLSLQDENAGDLISNAKLQKLVYYAQGFHLALFEEPLFDNQIMAWEHGPVVPELHYEYKRHGPGPLPYPTHIDLTKYDGKTTELLDEIYSLFGQYAGWKLRDMTHEEPPWHDVQEEIPCEIDEKTLGSYFKTQLD